MLVRQPKNDKSGFLAQANYTFSNWRQLDLDLRALLQNEATLDKQTQFGDIYEIKGALVGSNGVRSYEEATANGIEALESLIMVYEATRSRTSARFPALSHPSPTATSKVD